LEDSTARFGGAQRCRDLISGDIISTDNFMPGDFSDVTASVRPGKAANILWPGEDLFGSRWTRFRNGLVELLAGIAPNGEDSTTRLVESGDDSQHYINAAVDVAVPGAVHTCSFYFEPENRLASLEMRDGTPDKYGDYR
jgi:hypothetical protein